MIERRKRPRVRVASVAFIVTKTGNPVACRIIDQSEDGARLSVDSVLGIPNEFRLAVQRTGESFTASVVWRGPHELGVAFLATHPVPFAAPSLAGREPIEIPLDPPVDLPAPDRVSETLLSDVACEL